MFRPICTCSQILKRSLFLNPCDFLTASCGRTFLHTTNIRVAIIVVPHLARSTGRDGNGAVSNYDFHMRSDGTSRVIFSAPLPLIFQVLISARRLQMMSSVCHAKTRSAGWTSGLGHSAPARCSGFALNRPPQLSACSCGIKVKGNNEETSPLSGNS